ncbi:ARM repeat-containing protein [Auriculariales sp. MPI-PUGE-AT-0066]|nr:ARM repeat-containing protein [Auriculariales sp. MPI-PUGE-AT-0066]
MVSASPEELAALESTLLNTNGSIPLAQRFRALFTLKAIKSNESIDIISKENRNEDPMVRHEAAEAMGAISATSAIPVLQKYLNDPERAVRETCEIALAKIEWDAANKEASTSSADAGYTSVDPAPASTSGLLRGAPAANSPSVPQLRTVLLDKSETLFARYRAMFALRNIGTDEAILALADGFDDDSALFKHEIAFVFGQMSAPASVPALLKVLKDESEHEMVRHEAAEALGGIATGDVLPHLREYASRAGAPRVVRESCVVALDMYEYENSSEFQYADGLAQAARENVATA